MPRVVISALVVAILMIVGLSVAAPGGSARQNGTPAATPGAGTPTPVCSPEELAEGGAAEFLPLGEQEGVTPMFGWNGPEHLYLAMLTLPPESCIDFRYRTGAVVLFVQEGTVVYTSRLATTDPSAPEAAVVIVRGDSDGDDSDNLQVTPGTTITLHEGDWVTQDRRVWYSFRNSSGEDAVVIGAVFAPLPWDDDTCVGGCKGRP